MPFSWFERVNAGPVTDQMCNWVYEASGVSSDFSTILSFFATF